MTHPIVIVGSGLAAYMLAKEFRKLDQEKNLVIVTESDGRFYSKPLLSTALTHDKSPEVLAVSSSAEMAEELKAMILTHTSVLKIDADKEAIELSNGEWLSYSQLILAVGAELIHAPLTGDAVSDIYSVNDLQSYTDFRNAIQHKKKIAILGSGLVGCEFANDLHNAGYELNIIAPDLYPLQRFVPSEVGKSLERAFKEAGIQWHLERCVTAVNHNASGYRLELSDGHFIEAEVVLSAVGLRPNLNLAKTAGINTARGIIVNKSLRTNIPKIYALGDCAEVDGKLKLYVAPILQCARVLARVLLNESVEVHYPIMPIIIKTPLCPIAVEPPPLDLEVDWKITGTGVDQKALAYFNENLIGFALSGSCVKERMELIKQLKIQ